MSYFLVLFGLGLVKNTVGRLSRLSSVKLYMDRYTWLTCYLHGMTTVMANSSRRSPKLFDVLPTSLLSPTCHGTDLPRKRNSINNSVKNNYSCTFENSNFLKSTPHSKSFASFSSQSWNRKRVVKKTYHWRWALLLPFYFHLWVASSRKVSTK